ncbi:hypothetical protein PGT21_029903 [Puccinia graminis f. sp. tritici]|uniref:Uncharacterized protein n=1 Tax=Puccinia graminis f. sp. tritici TaxID=56615 RepID=A0A5B0Q6T6_PUCGR|nr:hypothetical protein PGT21_029903 [Puccinia graminis f. sp. tritici]
MMISQRNFQGSSPLFVLTSFVLFQHALVVEGVKCVKCNAEGVVVNENSQTLCNFMQRCGEHECGNWRSATRYDCQRSDCGKIHFKPTGTCNHQTDCQCQVQREKWLKTYKDNLLGDWMT